MQYMLLLYFDESAWPRMAPEDQQSRLAAYQSYVEALNTAGVLKASSRLRPSRTATTVRVDAGTPQVLDGPFVDTKEQLGGYFIIDVPDLDSAISWATRCPGATHGSVEVRPLGWQEEDSGS